MKIDFHVHTHRSPDSFIRPRDLARKSERLGIIPAITDHYSIKAHKEMRALGAPFIPGNEIYTDKGDLIALYFEQEPRKGIAFEEALDLIHGDGALAYLPHMFDSTRKGCGDPGPLADRIDLVEIFNARCLGRTFNDKAKAFALEHAIAGACGSDTHFLFEFGSTYSSVPDFDIADPKALMRSIRKAEHVMRSAPFFVRGPTSMLVLLRRLGLRP